MTLPYLNETKTQRQTVQAFRGLNMNPKAADGEWYTTTNLSGASSPCLYPRAKRGTVASIASSYAIGGDHEKLAYCAGTKLYYNGADTGLTLSTGAGMTDKRIVSFGTYLLVFPDKQFYNTADGTDKGSIEATFTSSGNIAYTICRDDGTDYDVADVTASDEPPAEPANGDYWIDTSAEVDTLMQYSSYSQSWATIPTVYTKIANTGIGASFAEYDAVTISGCAYGGADPKLAVQIPALNGSKMLYAAGANYIIVIGILDAVYTQTSGAVTVARTIPAMDHVCVSGNRVWGCFNGLNGASETVNEIYASRLGDFKNFASFMGISTDSYAVTVGQGGPFTGATSHLGYPMFFKERILYKVYGTRPANFQVMDTACAGVKDGSDKSIQIINSTLYYLSSDGEVVSYDGAMPSSLFYPFGASRYSDGIAGALDGVYYISVKDSASAYHLFTYDTRRGLWFREDAFRPVGFQFLAGELYALTTTTLWAMSGKAGSLESTLAWSATSGLIGWESPNQKYVSRFMFRVEMPTSSSVLLEIEYNSSGSWVSCSGKTVTSTAPEGTFVLPVRPSRCDHFRLKISGTGLVKVWSMDKLFELGGDGYSYI